MDNISMYTPKSTEYQMHFQQPHVLQLSPVHFSFIQIKPVCGFSVETEGPMH
jgi:hypothetical protein